MHLSAETPREFGEELRRERELRDVSRENLAAAIRISIRQLDALESGRFEILPAKVFSRGFVRAIALHLGLDAERYSAAFASVWDAWADAERSRTSSDLIESGQHVRLSKPRRAVSMSTFLVGGGIALVIALVTFGAVFLNSRGEHPTHSPSRTRVDRSTIPGAGPASLALPPSIASSTVALPSSSSPVSSAAATPVAVPIPAVQGPAESLPTAPRPREGLVLKMMFRDDCWTEVVADGRPVVAELFRKGAVKEFPGSRRFVVTLGNASGVSLSLNGAPVPLDGSSGKVVKNLILDESTARSRPSPG